MKLNSVIVGILISAGINIAGYGIISLIFEFMESQGVMDEAGSQDGKRRRTIWLLSICLNIVAIQFLGKRKTQKTQRGVAILTVLAAFTWAIFYSKSLFFVE